MSNRVRYLWRDGCWDCFVMSALMRASSPINQTTHASLTPQFTCISKDWVLPDHLLDHLKKRISLCALCHRFIQHPKNFGLIASFLERKVQFGRSFTPCTMIDPESWHLSSLFHILFWRLGPSNVVFCFRRWQNVSSSTTWPKRTRTTRTLCAGTTGAVAGARYCSYTT